MNRNYVGLACTFHDNALAIVNSRGEIVFAEATERYLQNKRAMCCPPDDLLRIGELIEQYCEPNADIVLAKTWSNNSQDIIHAEIEYAQNVIHSAKNIPAERLELFKIYRDVGSLVVQSIEQAGTNLRLYCNNHPTRNLIEKAYDHHLTHAAAGVYSSPFNEAVCAVVDGAGEKTALKFYHYNDGKIQTLQSESPLTGEGFASMGLFYGITLCGLCGFNGWKGEEWKVMGLAAYGKFDEQIYETLLNYIAVQDLRIVYPETANKAYKQLMQFARLPNEPAAVVADLAYTGQYFFSEIMTKLLHNLYDRDLSENLVLSGGCALNSSYNGQILERTKFKNLYVTSAPADDGNAVGAALLAFYQDHPDDVPQRHFQTPYLGSEMADETIHNLREFGNIERLAKLPKEQIYQRTAELLSRGCIVGWVQGRAEFGPRALGNRSILADPRRQDMKDRINSRVKFREEFRPFAPSILHEFGDEYFLNYQESPYMERTLTFKDEVREKIPAVVHHDGTGRLQTVKKEWNEDYYQLIYTFYEITGIPLILNTSLNIMGKPIVHSVEDATALFYTTGLDALVIDDVLIEKNPGNKV